MLPEILKDMTEFDETNEISRKLTNAIIDLDQDVDLIEAKDTRSFGRLSEYYYVARQWVGAIEAKRKEFTRGLRDQINAINRAAKDHTEVLDQIIETVNQKGADYALLYDQKQSEAYEHYVEQAKMYGVEETVAPLKRDSVIPGTKADLLIKYETSFEILDIDKVPSYLLKVDEAKIRSLIDNGITDVPGIKIKQTKKANFRIKG
jgi:hypothetical protein